MKVKDAPCVLLRGNSRQGRAALESYKGLKEHPRCEFTCIYTYTCWIQSGCSTAPITSRLFYTGSFPKTAFIDSVNTSHRATLVNKHNVFSKCKRKRAFGAQNNSSLGSRGLSGSLSCRRKPGTISLLHCYISLARREASVVLCRRSPSEPRPPTCRPSSYIKHQDFIQ